MLAQVGAKGARCACRHAARGWRCAARQSAPVELQHIAHTALWYGVCAPARLAAVRFGRSCFLARAPPLPSSRGACCELTPRRRGVAQPVQLQDDASGAGSLPRLLRHEPRPVRGALRAPASSGVGRPCVQPAGQRVLRRPARPHVERTTLTRTQLRIPRGSMAALGLRAALAPTAAPTLHTAHLGTEAVASRVRSLHGPLPAQSRPPPWSPISRRLPAPSQVLPARAQWQRALRCAVWHLRQPHRLERRTRPKPNPSPTASNTSPALPLILSLTPALKLTLSRRRKRTQET